MGIKPTKAPILSVRYSHMDEYGTDFNLIMKPIHVNAF